MKLFMASPMLSGWDIVWSGWAFTPFSPSCSPPSSNSLPSPWAISAASQPLSLAPRLLLCRIAFASTCTPASLAPFPTQIPLHCWSLSSRSAAEPAFLTSTGSNQSVMQPSWKQASNICQKTSHSANPLNQQFNWPGNNCVYRLPVKLSTTVNKKLRTT